MDSRSHALKTCAALSDTDQGRRFIHWAREALVPLTSDHGWGGLDALGHMIGGATAVALSEAVHGSAEPLEFRNHVLEYLVREKEFTAIAIESGIVESRSIHDYVLGGRGDVDTVLASGLSWAFDLLPQNRSLVEWLRAYNANPAHRRKVNFYGFDLPGSPSNDRTKRGIDTALVEAMRYLSTVDATASAALGDRLEPLVKSVRFGLRSSSKGPGYERLSQSQRDMLTACIADVVTLFERQESRYTAASTAQDYAWGYRAALNARQADAWLRHIPIGWQPVGESSEFCREHVSFLPIARDVRDRAQADNLDWILRQEGPDGKVLIFASRYHLSAAPVKATFWSVDGQDRVQEVAGAYLRRRIGERLITIGNLVGGGEAACSNYRQGLDRASSLSIDGLAGNLGVPLYLLDLRTAPVAVRKWLNEEHCLADGPQLLKLPIGEAFDVVFYIDTVTPACNAPVSGLRV